MPVLVKSPQVRSAQETVLTNAVLRAASKLDVSQAALAAILGVSEATVSRMKKGDYVLQADSKAFEHAVLFVRLFRSLDEMVGGDVARAWLANPNLALDAKPVEKIRTVPGLMDVITYLDELRFYREWVWRLVEAQYHVSLRKLTDSLAEQALLEGLVEGTKPAVPVECRGLDPLLSTPFRYALYKNGSRFRLADYTPGVYYAAEDARVAVAETAFYRLLFFAESPDTPWPVNPFECTGFRVEVQSHRSLDLTEPPFDVDAAVWRHPVKYSRCQEFADWARMDGAEILRYWSARDLTGGVCIAVLTCAAFAETQPQRGFETWRIGVSRTGAYAIREFPPDRIEFNRNYFGSDQRVAAMRWER